jgi:hypothetical protein
MIKTVILGDLLAEVYPLTNGPVIIISPDGIIEHEVLYP